MNLTIRMPSGELLAIEIDDDDPAVLKQRIEDTTGIPAVCQELQVAGAPLRRVRDVGEVTIDLILHVGPNYAIAAAEVGSLRGAETFRPAASLVRTRDFATFAYQSDRVNFTSVKPLDRARDLSDATARADARLTPYREHAERRRREIKQLRDSLGADDVVAMSFNAPYARLFENWHVSCVRNGIDVRNQTIVFPMDPAAQTAAEELGYATFYDPESYGSFEINEDVHFADRQWVDCLFMKNAVIGDFLVGGMDILFQDVDIVWQRNPFPYLRNKAHTESWDFMFHKAAINKIFQPLYYNSGFVYARSNDFSRLTWERVLDHQRLVYAYGSQQVPVNVIMNTFRERGLRTCALAPDLFVNGHLLRRDPEEGEERIHPRAYILHANWTDGLEEKLDRLRTIGFWYLDAERSSPAPQSTGRRATDHRDHSECVIADELRCVFFAIPKNASTSVRAVLKELDPTTRSERCAALAGDAADYPTFTFLRDPLERVLSAYNEVSLRFERGKTADLPFHHLPPGPDRFDAFLDCIETRPWDEHVRPQTDLLGEHTIDDWGHVDDLREGLRKLYRRWGVSGPNVPPHLNRRSHAQDARFVVRAEELSDGVVARIRRIYRRDYDLIAEVFGGNHPTAPARRDWSDPTIRSTSGDPS